MVVIAANPQPTSNTATNNAERFATFNGKSSDETAADALLFALE